ncbi:MAG TPA: S1C family serine protease [Terriglobia bacterium]|nr:S1C family serine protease [Terriglobia bacterium]
MENIWEQLSKDIADKVAAVGESIVVVDGRAGHTSSGIVWKPDYVLTASHAIRGESGLDVASASGKVSRARLAGRAPASDIALLKLDTPLETTAALTESASLRVGEFVVAVARTRRGNIVASSGILGGLMGEWRSGRARIDQFIRPDLTLYPGFSGGALIDSSGKVLGMMTSGLAHRKPMAIPISTLNRIGNELATKGHTVVPYVGVVMQPVSVPEKIQKSSGVATSAGLLVMHVEPSSPADNGGVLVGDILVSLDGQGVEAVEDLHDVLIRRGIHQNVPAILLRGGQKLELTLTIGERPVR